MPSTDNESVKPKEQGPLQGLRILDLTSVIMGPYATQQLGDLGAEIILVEPLEGGSNRSIGTTSKETHAEFSGVALNLLRNKRSLAMNLKDPRGLEALLNVIATCDVIVTNLRNKPLARLGLAYDDVKRVRDDIIFCQAQGFRSDGPRADDPAYDDIIQAESGIVDCFLRAGYAPTLLPTIAADKISGLFVVNSVLAALVHRARTGRGQRIEVPMLDVMQSFVMVEHGSQAVYSPPHGSAGYTRILTPARRPQKTKDGWLNILPYDPEHYDKLFTAGGLDHLVGDERTTSKSKIIANSDFLYTQVQSITEQRTTNEWLDFCRENKIPVGAISSLDEILQSYPIQNHPVAGPYRSVPSPVVFGAASTGLRTHAPSIGQDTEAILGSAGLSPSEIEVLISAGVVRASS